MLYCVVFREVKEENEKTYMIVTLPNGDEVMGRGPNKKVAKKSAAKRALVCLKAAQKKHEMEIDS